MVPSGVHLIRNDEELHVRTEELLALATKSSRTPEEEEAVGLLELLVTAYEDRHYPIHVEMTPAEALKALMEESGLKQRDLIPEIGSEALVSMILAGKRNLTVPQIQKLSARFHVSPELFLAAPVEHRMDHYARAAD
jgi:HTH-type transcriptional regulator/antitoxin HigA